MNTSQVTVEIIRVERTDDKPPWYSFRISNDSGGCIELGFQPTPEELEQRWGQERDFFVKEWSKL